ncbi:MAG: elongation factor G, partial [Candidatus Buchananbacteria bacterium]
IDTPGHIDFTVEVKRSLRVLDGGVVIFDGVAGVEPQSETNWHYADEYSVPRLCFINKMDRMGADFYADLRSIHERLTKNAYPMQLPIGSAETFKGLVDLLERKAEVYFEDDSGTKWEVQEVPPEMKEDVEKYRHQLVEVAAEQDDVLMNKYLNGEELTIPEIKRGLRLGVIRNKFVLVLCGSALKNKGIQFMLDAVNDYLPSPLDIKPPTGMDVNDIEKKIPVVIADNQPFVGLAFKIASDPFVGKLAYFRIYSGILKSGSYVVNNSNGERERVSRIVRMHANSREEVDEVYAGEIAAIVGLKNTTTGDTISDPEHPIILERIVFPEPVISVAIEPKTNADQEKMGVALQKLAEEDPTFRVHTDEETMQTIIEGMGELHLDIIVDRMKREFKVEANVGKPQVAYRETIKKKAEGEGKYIRQSGGRGQYGHCWLRIEPLEPGKGFEFEDKIKSGSIPREYIAPIGKGVKEALDKGVLAGYQLIDIKATVYDGSYHDVDSSEAAFKIAGSLALQEAVKKADPILLEPIMKVEIITPEQFMGDVMGDINAKRGQIIEMRDRSGVKVIDAKVPLAEMFGYATQLRSMTQGRASYNMELERYMEVPKNVALEIIEGRKK